MSPARESFTEFVTGRAARVPGAVSVVGYRARGLPEGTHLGVPSASLTFILSLDGPVEGADTAEYLAAGRTTRTEVLLSGLHDRAAHIRQPTRQEGIQLAVDPLAARALFGRPAAALAPGMGDPDALGRTGRDLWQRVGDAGSWDTRFAALAAQCSRWATRELPGPRPDIAEAWRLLSRRRGAVTVEEVARHVALSGRQLRTEFHREFGVGPKQAARLMRFEHALARMAAAVRDRQPVSLAGIAADCGYADQSHLTREVRGYLGLSPSAWLAQERRNIQVGGHAYREEWLT